MPANSAQSAPLLSVIVPAHNEAGYIEPCLQALCAQTADAAPFEVILSANACTDGTEQVAAGFADALAAKGGTLRLISSDQPGKLGALNRAEDAAHSDLRIYLDADVICDPALLGLLRSALNVDTPRYATGRLQVAPGRSWITRCYANFWTRLPFVQSGAVGAGLFALNGPGRARWDAFPDIISDDTFVRLNFTPNERVEVPAAYHWPMVEGFENLVRVRRRQDAGVAEIYRNWPDLRANEGKASMGLSGLAKRALSAPISFAVYAAVSLAVRTRSGGTEWTRGR